MVGVETGKGFIAAEQGRAWSRPGTPAWSWRMAGLRMPLESTVLQALVSEPVKPVFPCVVMSNTIHAYISQSDKGELVIGAGSDQYNSYSQRGSFQIVEHTLEAICELFPIFSRMRMLRHWGGIVDVTADRSPIVGKTPLQGLYVNCGWGTGGFKATPGSGHVFAHTVAHGRAAPDQRAVRARPLHHRPPDRRGGRRRRGALRTAACCCSLPLLRPAARDRVPLRRRGRHRCGPTRRRRATRTGPTISTTARTRRACTTSAGAISTAAAAGSTRSATR